MKNSELLMTTKHMKFWILIILTIWIYEHSFSIADAKDITYIIDSRDGNKYKVIKIHGMWWFAENLRFNAPNSFCYENDPANCKTYGRLYKHNDLANVCPSGWGIPTTANFDSLVMFLKSKNLNNNSIIDPDYWQLRDRDSINNSTGLSIKGSGWKVKKKYSGLGTAAHFWLFEPQEPEKVHHVHMGGALKEMGYPDLPYRHEHSDIKKKRLFSCRCVRKIEEKFN